MAALLELAKGGNQYVQLATILVVVLSGGGNFLGTWQTGRETQRLSREDREDVLKAMREIHQIHDVIDETVRRQQDIQAKVNQLANQQK